PRPCEQNGTGATREGYEKAGSDNHQRPGPPERRAQREKGKHASSVAPALAAEDTRLRAITRPGDRIVLSDDVYGGTYRLLTRVLGDCGIVVETVDMSDLAAVERVLGSGPAPVLWVATPINTLVKLSDIRALAV
ncbi:PLP-dependent transferase, partial [Clavibacter michiganensis]|uniref:PLP-dependent transferase n=1 Tax=Clavibacter michiganensis TaxID=28447 RepID=UPI002931DCD8